MQEPGLHLVQVLQQVVLHRDVGEPVAGESLSTDPLHPDRCHQVVAPGQRLAQVADQVPEVRLLHPGDHLSGEDLPLDGRDHQAPQERLREPRQPLADDTLDAGRELVPVQVPDRHPAPAVPPEDAAVVLQVVHQLHREQRMTTGPCVQRAAELLAQLVRLLVQERIDEGPAVLADLQVKGDVAELAGQLVDHGLQGVLRVILAQHRVARAVGPHDEHPGALQPPADPCQERQGRGVGPLQVIQHHEERELLAQPAQHLHVLLQDLVLVDRGLGRWEGPGLWEVRERVPPRAPGPCRLARHHDADVGQESTTGDQEPHQRWPERTDGLPAQAPDAVGMGPRAGVGMRPRTGIGVRPRLAVGVPYRFPVGVRPLTCVGSPARPVPGECLEHLPERQERIAPTRLGVTPADGHDEVLAARPGPGGELGDQAGLAGAALPPDEQHPPRTAEDLVEHLVQAGQLRAPGDQIEPDGVHHLMVGMPRVQRKGSVVFACPAARAPPTNQWCTPR